MKKHPLGVGFDGPHDDLQQVGDEGKPEGFITVVVNCPSFLNK